MKIELESGGFQGALSSADNTVLKAFQTLDMTPGVQGNQGNQGNQGYQGTTGTGNQGDQGNQGNQGSAGTQGNQGNQGAAGPALITYALTYTFSGIQVAAAGTLRMYPPANSTIVSCTAYLTTPAVGANFLVDINKGGTTVLSTPLSIAAGDNASAVTAPSVTTISTSEYFTVDRDQIGSSTPGSDLTVRIILTIP
jgi:hypothetical protein